jgi:hypothetical protein
VALGSDDFQGAFHIHELALGSDGEIRLTSTERLKVHDAGVLAMPRALNKRTVRKAAPSFKPAA